VKHLIVNADDFGLTKQVNRGIVEAHHNGIVTSTTLLANGEAFESAVALASRAPQLGIGAHLNLSEGTPISPPSTIPSLVDSRGRLHLTPGRLAMGILLGRISLSDVERELRAQVEKVLRAGISPTHFDGHKHIHVLPRVSALVVRLAQQYDIPGLRCPIEKPAGLTRLLGSRPRKYGPVIKQYVVGRQVSRFARRFKKKLEQGGLVCPLSFLGLSETGFLDVGALRDILTRLPQGTSELMCHPGYVDSDLRKTGTRLLAEREVEVQALTALQIKKFTVDRGIRLINYRGLIEPVHEAAA
jgi:hopanoid biosynthesis associated protein HpnK